MPYGAMGTRSRPGRARFLRGLAGLLGLFAGSHCGGEGRSLKSLSPGVGSVLGGEEGLLSGSGLSDASRVVFGGSPATITRVEGPGGLRLVVPPSAVRGEQIVSALWSDGLLLSLPEPFTYHALQLAPSSREWVKTGVLAQTGWAPRGRAMGATLDLVLATDEPQALHRLAGDGQGHFSWVGSQPLRSQVTALSSADLDGDGRDDLIAAEGARQALSLWLGGDDGRFRSGGEVAVGCVAASLATGDLLGDARPELIVGCRDATSVAGYVFENRWPDGATSRFAPPQALSLPGGVAIGTVQVVVAGLDGGRPTLAATLGRRGGLLLCQGSGGGNLGVTATLPTGLEPSALVAADLNGDGRSDLVTVDGGGTNLSYYLWPASGLPTPQSYALPPGYDHPALAALDWDGDGRRHELILSPGPGAAESPPLLPLRLTEAGALAALPRIEGTAGPLLPLAWPLTAGAAPSLIALSPDGHQVQSLAGSGPAPTPSDGLPPPHALVTADLTSDGHLDAAWLSGSRIALLLGDDRQIDDGQNPLPLPRYVELGSERSAPRSLFAADVNGDWLGDLVVGDGAGLQLLLARGPAQYQPALYVDLGLGAGLGIDALSVADIDEDGRADVVAASAQQAAIWLLLGNGNGTLRPAQRIALPGSLAGVADLRIVDQDGDGHRDILALAADTLHIVSGLPGGRLAAPRSLPLPIVGRHFVVPDLNFDGLRDVVVGGAGEPRLAVLRARADGSLSPEQILTVDAPLLSLVAEDLDRDGQLDIAATLAQSGELRVFLGRADGSLTSGVRVAAGQPTLVMGAQTLPGSLDLAALDLTGDAERDLFVLGRGAYQVLRRTPPR